MTKARLELRRLLAAPEMLIAPGGYDGITARLIEQAGFSAVYMTGAGNAASFGLPDYGLLSMTEMVGNAARMASATQLPLIADADTGYATELNVVRTVQEHERAGTAAIHIEDQVSPKRCGHLDGKELVSRDEFAAKIQAAVATRQDPDFVVIARTDARSVAGFDEAIARANLALDVGADLAFVESPESVDEVRLVTQRVQGPCLLNVVWGVKTPQVSMDDAQAMGYRLAILPGVLLKTVYGACDQALAALQQSRRHPTPLFDSSVQTPSAASVPTSGTRSALDSALPRSSGLFPGQPSAEAQHHRVSCDGEDDDEQYYGGRQLHVVLSEAAHQQEAQPTLRGEHLADQHSQKAERKAEPQPGHNLRQACRHEHPAHRLRRRQSHRPCRSWQHRRQRLDIRNGEERDRHQSMHHAERHLCSHAEPENEENHRIQCDFWDRVKASQNRLGNIAGEAPQAEHEAQQKAKDGGQGERDRECGSGRDGVVPEPAGRQELRGVGEGRHRPRHRDALRPAPDRLPKQECDECEQRRVEEAQARLPGGSGRRCRGAQERTRRRSRRPSQL